MDTGIAETNQVEAIPIPETATAVPSAIMYTLHKAGSVYFGNCVRTLAESVGMPGINMASHYFNFGYDQIEFPQEAKEAFRPIGYFYGPFRYLKLSFEIPNFDRYTKFLIVRDPRDILTSRYFSNKFSHPMPPPKPGEAESAIKRTNLDIDNDVLSVAPRFLNRFADYLRFVGENDVPIYRYEDIIDDFEPWLRNIAKVIGIEPSADVVKALVDQHVSHVDEDFYQHRRQIRPGDHQRKLRPETVEALNEIFKEPLRFFAYP